jgi:hypothetical protein
MLAPICLFVFDRPLHTKKVLSSLAENEESKNSILYIYSDGIPKNVSKERLNNIILTRKIISNEKRFKKINLIINEKNRGLSNSLIKGISQVCNKHNKVIVVEDDLIVNQFFLRYMNDALDKYQNNNKVGAICGYFYPIEINDNNSETFFLSYNSCWGWATWKRSWNDFEIDGDILLKKIKLKSLEKEFDLNNSQKHVKMLKYQVNGLNDSWAIRWAASLFLSSKLSLFPRFSLVKNIGFDGSGIHSSKELGYEVKFSNDKINFLTDDISENINIRKQLETFFKKLNTFNSYQALKRIFSYSSKLILEKIVNRFKINKY